MPIEISTSKEWSNLIGCEIKDITLGSKLGTSIRLVNYGAIMLEINTPDRFGNIDNILLSYDNIEGYLDNKFYLNSAIGLTGGRIKNGMLNVNGEKYTLPKNNNGSTLHGGPKGLDKKVWEITDFFYNDGLDSITLKHHHSHLEDGYPGEIDIFLTYSLKGDRLSIEYAAKTDIPTVLNLTQHNYYNLSGSALHSLDRQRLLINSKYFYEIGEDGLPYGKSKSIIGSNFDYSSLRSIYSKLDNPFLTNIKIDPSLPNIIYQDDYLGRTLAVSTNQESIVVYTNNDIFKTYKGICFEAQALPGTMLVLSPGETYRSTTTYDFGLIGK